MNAAAPSPLAGFVPLLAMVAIFYFLVIRPQQKQQKEHDKMLEALKKGDRILTNGGLYGLILNVKGPDLEVRIADNVKVLVSRAAVSKLASNPELASSETPAEKV
ncbi:MAG: preprotein translocase subunit YajC [Elusimicrobia bacterium]|nr:preprotein translocase subunit YajC [Elusimicrobiota bacterium]